MYKIRLLNMFLRRKNNWIGYKTAILNSVPENSIYVCETNEHSEVYKYYITKNKNIVHHIVKMNGGKSYVHVYSNIE